MKVILDDVDFAMPEGDSADAKAVFDAVRREATSKSRVVSRVIVDDAELDDHDEFYSLSGAAEARFITQPIRELVVESINEGGQYLPILREGLEGIATDLEAGRDNEALTKFSKAVEGINWLIAVFDKSCSLTGVTVENLSSGNFEEDFNDMRGALEEMATAIENGKTMTLAYLIREKLLPSVDRFSLYWSEVSSLLETPLQ